MFDPDFDQNRYFSHVPDKRRSAIAFRLFIALLKTAGKSMPAFVIFELSTGVDNFVRNSMANFTYFPVG